MKKGNSSSKELKILLKILKNIIWDMELPWNPKHVKVGRPPHNPRGLAVLAILQRFVNMTDREFESFILENQWLLKEVGINKEISRSSFYLARTKITKEYLTQVNIRLLRILLDYKSG